MVYGNVWYMVRTKHEKIRKFVSGRRKAESAVNNRSRANPTVNSSIDTIIIVVVVAAAMGAPSEGDAL